MFNISWSERAPGDGFHPNDKSDTIYCGFSGPSWRNKKKKIDPEGYVSCCLYELLLSNVAF